MFCQHVKYKITSDKTGTAGYDNVNKNAPMEKSICMAVYTVLILQKRTRQMLDNSNNKHLKLLLT